MGMARSNFHSMLIWPSIQIEHCSIINHICKHSLWCFKQAWFVVNAEILINTIIISDLLKNGGIIIIDDLAFFLKILVSPSPTIHLQLFKIVVPHAAIIISNTFEKIFRIFIAMDLNTIKIFVGKELIVNI